MLFFLSKVAWFLASPSNLLTFAALLGAAASSRRWGRRICLLNIVLLAGLGLAPVGHWLLLPLDSRFAAYRDDGAPIAGVIVLGGGVHSATSFARDQLTVGDSAERVIAMADLARRHPQARIVFSGGAGSVRRTAPPEADAVARYGAALGLDVGRITFENRSRTTAENASETRALVTPAPGERWLLVTSAWHMPRAIGVFRKQGFPVIAYPVDYRTGAAADLYAPTPSVANGLDRLDTAVREWLGLFTYRLAGRTDALLPGP